MRRSCGVRFTVLLLAALAGLPARGATTTTPAMRYVEAGHRLLGQTVKVEDCNLSSFGVTFGYCDVYRDRQSQAIVWSIRVETATLARADLSKALALCARSGRSEQCWVNIVGIPGLDPLSDANLPMMRKASFEWVGYRPPPLPPRPTPSLVETASRGLFDWMAGTAPASP